MDRPLLTHFLDGTCRIVGQETGTIELNSADDVLALVAVSKWRCHQRSPTG